MKRGTASIGVDQFAEFAAAVTRSLPRDLDPTFVQMLIQCNGRLSELLKYGLTKGPLEKNLFIVQGKYATPVDYEMPLDQVGLERKFDYVDPLDITKLPVTRKGKAMVEIWVVDLNCQNAKISILSILEGLDRMGLRPADPREFISLGTEHPDLQRKIGIGTPVLFPWFSFFSVVALLATPETRLLRVFHEDMFSRPLQYVAAVPKGEGILNLPRFFGNSKP